MFRRGPSGWSHVGCWHIVDKRYEPGDWLKGRIFPRRCDLSPDGRWLCCFIHKANATWEHGETYVAVSRLPRLAAVHAFGTCGTWTRGYHFTDGTAAGGRRPAVEPANLIRRPATCSRTRRSSFAVERRRGWRELPDCAPRDPADAWDQRRNARLQKRQPGGERILHIESLGHPGGELDGSQTVDGLRVSYAMEYHGDIQALDGLQWADWDRTGRLLVATRSGAIQIRDPDADGDATVFEEDLSRLSPGAA